MASVLLKDRSFGALSTPGLVLTPTSWSGSATQGFKRATIDVAAPDNSVADVLKWLRFDTTILGDNGSIVWNGYVSDILVYIGSLSIGISLDRMANKIQCLYSYKNSFGRSQSDRTAWSSDTMSVSIYGTKESVVTKNNVSQAEAEQFVQTKLALMRNPLASIDVSSPRFGARLTCRGWFSTLSWRQYQQTNGHETYDGSLSADQPLGLGFTSTGVGFDTIADVVADINGQFKNFHSGYKFLVSGSVSNNTTFIVDSVKADDVTSVSSALYQFDASDDILNSAAVMADFKADDMIRVTGSSIAGNNRYFFVDTNSPDHITVRPKAVSTTAVQSATVARGNSVSISGNVTTEYPTTTVTVTAAGKKIAQHLSLLDAGSWDAYYALVNLKKVGVPSDNVVAQLCTTSGAGSYTVIATATLAGTSIDTSNQWYTFTFATPVTLTSGTNYALVLSRSGADNYANFYVVSVDEDVLYPRGNMYVYDGVSWYQRPTTAQMPFSIFGKRAIDLQIGDVLTASGQFLPTYDVPTSGQTSEQYMDKPAWSDKLIDELMQIGTTATKRYTVRVFPSRHVQFYVEPTYDTANVRWTLKMDGTIIDSTGKKIEPGVLIYGEWIDVDLSIATADDIATMRRIYVEESEFSASSGMLNITPRMGRSYSDLEIVTSR